MSERSKTHVMEEKSKRVFINSISPEWVVRTQDPDYGLDMKVEIFIGGNVSPFHFYVQLKSTVGIKSDKQLPKYSFSTQRILEYIEYPVPVMLVLYDINNDKLYYSWVESPESKYDFDEIRKLKIQKEITIYFEDRLDLIDREILQKEVISRCYQKGLVDESKTDFNVVFDISFNQEFGHVLKTEFSSWIGSEPKWEFIKVVNGDTCDVKIGITSKNEMYFITNGTEIPSINAIACDRLNFNEALNSTKIFIVITLALNGRTSSGLDLLTRIIFEDPNCMNYIDTILSAPVIAKIFGEKGRAFEAFRLSEILIENNHYTSAGIFATSFLHEKVISKYKCQEYRRILHKILLLPIDQKGKATFHYNLGNSLRHSDLSREAIRQYLKASRSDSAYLNYSYWWGEIAGSFFESGKYLWAEKCYRRAIELGERWIHIKAFLADTLLFQYRFSEAMEEIGIYFKEVEYPICEYLLKYQLLNFFVEKFNDLKKDTNKAESLIEMSLSASNEDERRKLLTQALNFDPLSGLAWFNYSVSQSQVDNKNRWLFWLITALLQKWDIEAWSNAVLTIISKNSEVTPYISMAVIYQAHSLFGQKLYSYIHNYLENNGRNDDDINYIINLIIEMVNNSKYYFYFKTEDPMVYRWH